MQPADQIDDGQHGAALEDAQAKQHGELGENIGKKLERDHALALVDGPLADNVAGGIIAAEPDGGYHHEEMHDGQLLGDFVEMVGAQGVTDQHHQHGEERRLHQQNGGLGAVLQADDDVALDQGEPLAEAELAAWLFFAGLVGAGRLLAAAVGDELLAVAGGHVALTPGVGAVGFGNGVHAGEEHLRVQLRRLDGRAGGGRIEELDRIRIRRTEVRPPRRASLPCRARP